MLKAERQLMDIQQKLTELSTLLDAANSKVLEIQQQSQVSKPVEPRAQDITQLIDKLRRCNGVNYDSTAITWRECVMILSALGV